VTNAEVCIQLLIWNDYAFNFNLTHPDVMCRAQVDKVVHEEGCLGNSLICTSRWSSATVALIGAALTAYSLYLVVAGGGFNTVSAVVFTIGLVDLLGASFVAWKGVQMRSCLDMWFWGFGLVTFVQLVLAVLFIIPSTRDSITSAIPEGVSVSLVFSLPSTALSLPRRAPRH
jgi:hypothetical protein